MMEPVYRMILTKYRSCVIVGYYRDEKPVEYQIFSEDHVALGTIFVGRIRKVMTNLGASFVDYADGVKGYLPGTSYKQGELVAVQLKKAAMKTKDAVLDDVLSLTGVGAVVETKKGNLSISQKIDSETHKQYKKELAPFVREFPYRVIIRTNATNLSLEDLKAEITLLCAKLDEIKKKSSTRTAYSILYAPKKEYIKAILDIQAQFLTEIITDDMTIYEEIKEELLLEANHLFSHVDLKLHQDSMYPLIKRFGIESKLTDTIKPTVWLKSGGYLVIEPTEALTSIDVNTGKTVKKGSSEETFFKTNKEAAVEIARQLRLRNISGMILIDFINMQDGAHDKELMKLLQEELKKDPIRATVHDMTMLGLVEVTRMKVRPSIYEQIKQLKN